MTTSSVERRAFKNVAVGALSFLVTLCQTVVLVPVLLKQWGNVSYGLWLTLMAGYNLLVTLDSGHQSYIGNQLNILYHTDLGHFRRSLGSSLLIAYLLGLAEIAICIALIGSGGMPLLLSASPEVIAKHQLSLGLLLLMLSWALVGSVGGIVVKIMIPAGLLHVSQWIGLVARLLLFVSIIMVACYRGSILATCLCVAILQIVFSLLTFLYIKRKLPQLYPWWLGANWNEGFRSLQKSLVLTFNSIGQQLSNNGLVILISALFTSAVIPSFTTLRTLTNTATMVTTVLIASLLPDMVRYHATREPWKLKEVFNANWFISGACVNFGIVLVLPVIRPIYRLWTKGYLEFNPMLFFLLSIAVSLVNFGAGPTQYLAGINDLRAQLVITIARAGVLFLVGYVLNNICGILGIGIACILAEVVASVLLPVVFVNRHLAMNATRLAFKHVYLAMAPPLLLVVAAVVMMVRPVNVVAVILLLVPVLALIYYASWKMLGPEVKNRLGALAVSLAKKLSINPWP